jgi:exodeoxyribonuclease VII large subunit
MKRREEIISVGEYLDTLNLTLKEERAKIIGEVSGLQMYEGKNYLFFSLRDTKDGSVINCIMWKNDYRISGVPLRDGLEIVITAYPDVYKATGRLSFKVELVELVGEGALRLAYETLKNKLELEGLFLENRKRALPDFPQRIGIITSRNGAVIHDFLSNIGKFGFEILFVDSRVEGQDSAKDLLSAVETFKHKNLDVLVIMRGGGSLESFLSFNNEMVVRAVADFPAPVLTGIGHDKDEPLVALVSDKNVSTPTAVANLLNSSWNEARGEVRIAEERILGNFSAILDVFHKAEGLLSQVLNKIDSRIQQISNTINMYGKEISREFVLGVEGVGELLQQSGKTLELSNPTRQLARGYSIVKVRGKVVRRRGDVSKNDSLEVMVSDGIINTKVI